MIEAILKLLALRSFYFKDSWNVFDFLIVIGTFASILLTELTEFNIGAATTFIRAFRIARILRLVKKAKSLRIIFETFIITIPALSNVGGLLMLFLYMYSVLGVFLFAEVEL